MAAAAALVTVQCDLIAPPEPVTYVFEVNPDSQNLSIGDTVAPFTGTLTANGVSVTFRLGVDDDPNGIVTVTPDHRLFVRARGRTELIVHPISTALTDDSLRDTVIVYGAVPRIGLAGGESAVDTMRSLGETFTVRAAALTNRGDTIRNVPLVFAIPGGAPAVVLEDTAAGRVRAVQDGVASVQVSVDNVTVTRSVRVKQLATQLATPDTIRLGAVGQTRAVADTIRDARANLVAGLEPTWESLNNGIATVNASGVVTAMAGGTTRIVARYQPYQGPPLADTTTVIVTQGALLIVAGNGQRDTVAAALAIPFMVQLVDPLNGNAPLATSGVRVSFAVATGGGKFGGAATFSDTTNAQGRVSATLTLGTTVGTNTVSVSGVGLAGTAVIFTATGGAAAPVRLQHVAGDEQVDTVGQRLPQTLTVMPHDQYDNHVPGVGVLFRVTQGGGLLANGRDTMTVVGDSTGLVEIAWSLGTVAGPNVLAATVAGIAQPHTCTATAVPDAPASLDWVQQPANIVAGASFAPAPSVRWADQYGNLAPATGTVTVRLMAAGATPDAVLVGTVARAAVAGVAAFPGLSVDKIGTGYRIVAEAAPGQPIVPDTSDAFDVTAGAIDHLAFAVQPVTVGAGEAIAPAVRVCLVDALGNVVTGNTGRDITLLIGTTPAGGTNTLSGTTTQATVNGCATFDDLQIAVAAAGYRLRASSPGTPSVSAVLSATFGVGVGVPASIAIVSGNNQNAIITTLLADSFVVEVRDQVGGLVTGDTVTFAVLDSDANLGGDGADTVVTGTNGRAAALLRAGTAPGNYQVRAVSRGLVRRGAPAPAVTFQFSVSAADLFLEFVSEPGTITGGSRFNPAVQVRVRDALGATQNASPIITLTIVSGTGASGATVVGTASQAATGGVATFGDVGVDKVGAAYRLAAAAAGLTPDTSVTFDVTLGAPAQLRFVQQPLTVTAGAPFTLAPSVAVTDAGGNVVTSASEQISLVFVTSSVRAGTHLRGTTTAQAVNGIATFPGLSVDSAGSGYKLKADPPGGSSLTAAESETFAVVPGPALRLRFGVQPVDVTAGLAIAPAVTVLVEDSIGNTVTTSSRTVGSAIATNAGGATLGGTVSQSAVAGVATFANLRLNRPGSGYTLVASSSGLESSVSGTFAVAAGAPSRLVFRVSPGTAAPGAWLSPAPVVELQDSLGNVATGAAGNVSVAITAGTGTSGAVLGGNTTVGVEAGRVTFDELTIDREGSGFTLTATFSGVTGVSAPFNVLASAALRLVYIDQPPASVRAGTSLGSVRVAVQDGVGVTQTAATGTVTVALTAGTGTAGAHLRGTTSQPLVSGVATFDNLSIDSTGIQYTLSAAHDGSLPGAVSNAVTVESAGGWALAFRVQPTSRTAGTVFLPALEVAVLDTLGNLAPESHTVTMEITSGTGSAGARLSGTTSQSTAGGAIATFSDLSIDKAGTDYTLTARAPGLAVTSSSFSITVGALARIVVSPAGVTLNGIGATHQLTATGVDAAGNTVSGLSFTWSGQALYQVANVSASGLVTAVGVGQGVIEAQAGGFIGFALATVIAPPPSLSPLNMWKVDTLTSHNVPATIRAVWGMGDQAVAVGDRSRIFHWSGSAWTEHGGGNEAYDLAAVWGTNPNHAYAVGSGGQVLEWYAHYGTSWVPLNTGLGGIIWQGIWGSSPNDVYLVGYGGAIGHWDGYSWSQVQHGLGDPQLRAVWGSSASDVWAVGTTVLHFDGTRWSELGNPAPGCALIGVWGTSPSNVYAVYEGCGDDGVVLVWDGVRWSQVDRGSGNFHTAVHGTSPSELFVSLCCNPGLTSFDGSAWTYPPAMVDNDDWRAFGVFATQRHVWVAMTGGVARGIRGGTVTINESWTTLASLGDTVRYTATARDGGGAEVRGVVLTWTSTNEGVVTVDANGLVTAVADGSASVIVTARGGAADTVQVAVTQAAASITINPLGFQLAAGSTSSPLTVEVHDARGNLIPGAAVTWSSANNAVAEAVYDGSSYRVTGVGNGQTTIYAASGAVSAHTVATVASPSATAVNLWSPMASGTTDLLHGVWGATANKNIFAFGAADLILRYDGSSWVPAWTALGSSWKGGWGINAVSVYATGDRTAWFDGSQWWSNESTPSGLAIWGSDVNDIYVVGAGRPIAHYDGQEWRDVHEPEVDVYGVWGRSQNEVYAVGDNGTILTWNGASWSAMGSGTSAQLLAVWGTAGSVFAVGDGGTILRYDGSNWSPMTSGTTCRLRGVTGSSASDVYTVAEGCSLILRYDGTSWLPTPSGTTQPLVGVFASPGGDAGVPVTPGGDVFAVGFGGTILRGHRGATVTITPDAPTLTALGATVDLLAEARDAATAPVSGVAWTWTSCDAGVAAVDSAGVVTAVAGGNTCVVATAPGGAADTVTVSVTPPTAPTVSALAQYQSDDATPISVGGQATATRVSLRAAANDPNAGAVIRMEWEVRPLDTPFANAATLDSPGRSGGETISVFASDLGPSTSYHWQVRACDEGGLCSSWAAFGGNAETDADFTVSTTPVDATAPVIAMLALHKTAVTTTAQPDTVLVTFTVGDNLSGVSYAYVSFSNAAQTNSRSCHAYEPVTGTRTSGTFACWLNWPAYGEGGTWTLGAVSAVDQAGNVRGYMLADAQANGWPTTITVTSNSDAAAPVIASLALSKAAVTTTSQPDTVLVTFTVGDNLAGVSYAYVSFSNAAQSSSRSCHAYEPVTGTRTSGTFACWLNWPAYGEGGTWTLGAVSAVDQAGNVHGYTLADAQANGWPTTITVTSNSDVAAPVVASLALSKAAVTTTSQADTVLVTFTVGDNLSGVSYAYVSVSNAAQTSSRSCFAYEPVAGTRTSGTFACWLNWPAYGEGGTWTLGAVSAVDQAGNVRGYTLADAQANGWPTTIRVNGSLPVLNAATLGQYQADGTTAIAVGGSTNERSVVIKGSGSDADAEDDQLTLQVEARRLGTAFSDAATHSATFTTGGTAVVTLTGLPDSAAYHWQARVCDEAGGCSPWSAYGGNGEAAADFVSLVPVGSVAVTPAGASLSGGTQTFTAEVRDAAGNVLSGRAVTWASLNPNVATIDPATGVATAVASGQVTISATAEGTTNYALLTVAIPGATLVNLWAPMASGTTATLFGIWGTSSSDIYAAGHRTVLHYDGATWSGVSSTPRELFDVWGASSSDVYLAGNGHLLRYNGASWSDLAPGDVLTGIWGASGRNVFAAGLWGALLRYDGTTLAAVASGTTESLQSVWGTSASDVYAVGAQGTILRFDGTNWTPMTSSSTSGLQDVWGTAASDIYAVGSGGTVLHYDGAEWSAMTSGTTRTLIGIGGTSSSDLYAVGLEGTLLRNGGTGWSTVPSGTSRWLRDVWAAPNSDVYVVGDSGLVLRGVRGATMAVTPADPTLTALGATLQLTATARDAANNVVSGLTFIWASSNASVATVSSSGIVTAVANGTATITATAPGGASGSTVVTVAQVATRVTMNAGGASLVVNGTHDLDAVVTDADGAVVTSAAVTWTSLNTSVATVDAAGVVTGSGAGQAVIRAQSGSALGYSVVTVTDPSLAPVNLLAPVASPVARGLHAVWGAGEQTAPFAVGKDGVILRYDGNSWFSMTSPTQEELSGVHGTSDRDVFATGGGGTILHFDGANWSAQESGTGDYLTSVWAAAPNDVFVTSGSSGRILRYDGRTWTQTETPATSLQRVWGFSARDVWAVGSPGTVIHYDGNTWTSVASGTTTYLLGLWGSSPNSAWIAGLGVIRHWDGSSFSTPPGAAGYYYAGIFGTSDMDVYALGNGGSTIERYDGSSWSAMQTGFGSGWWEEAWGSSSGDLYVVGMDNAETSARILRGVRGATVTVTPATPTLTSLNGTQQLTATARTSGGTEVPGVTFTWASSVPGVATVSATGLVTAVANGTAQIIAAAPGGAADTVTITVSQVATSIVVAPGGASISGGTQVFTADARDANNNPVSGVAITWSSLNPNVATMSGGGVATPVASGQVTIAATANGVTGYALLTVAIPGATSVNLWTTVTSPTGQSLLDVWAATPNAAFAVGFGGTILGFDGSAWTVRSHPGYPTDPLNGVWGTSGNDVYVVGPNSQVLHFDGSAWSLTTDDTQFFKTAVWGASPATVYAGGEAGRIARLVGNAWQEMPGASSNSINGMWGWSGSNVIAVGAGGAIVHYDGDHWSSMSSGTAQGLTDVWGASPTDVFATGYGVMLHYDGAQWSPMTLPETGLQFTGIWGTSSSDVYAVSPNRVWRYNGTQWSEQTTPLPPPPGFIPMKVAGVPGGDVFVVRDGGVILRGVRGATLTVTPANPTLTALGATQQLTATARDAGNNTVSGVTFSWSSSNTAVATVSSSGVVTAVANGTATITATAPGGASDSTVVTVNQVARTLAVSPAGASISGVGATTALSVTAQDSLGNAIASPSVAWSSLNANVATVSAASGLVSAVAAGQVTIVATAGSATASALVTVTATPAAPVNLWATMTSGTTADLKSVWRTPGSDVFAVGTEGTILRYNGTTWSAMSSGRTDTLTSVWGLSPSAAYAASRSGSFLRYDGTAWSAHGSGSVNVLGGWGASPSDLWVAGYRGGWCVSGCTNYYESTAQHYDGTTWALTVVGWALSAVWGSSASNVIGVGNGAIVRFDGTAWNPMSGGGGTNWSGVWGASSSDVFATGVSGQIARWNGASWSPMTSATTADLAGVWGASNQDVYAVGSGGAIVRFDGTSWSAMSSGTTAHLRSVTGGPSGDVIAVGDAGAVLRGVRGATIVVTPANPMLIALGATQQLTATGRDASSNVVSGVTFTWSSSNTAVATVSSSGVVTAVANGTATITATAPGGAAGSAAVTVDHRGAASRIAAAGASSCALTGDGVAYCWGLNTHGYLGDGTTEQRSTPGPVSTAQRFVSLVSGEAHTCGLTSSGAAHCWGYNDFGQLGDGTTEIRTVPVQVSTGLVFASLAAGGHLMCGLTADSTAYCWGRNDQGELGDGTLQDRSTPVAVGGSLRFGKLAVGFHHACGLGGAGIAYCWGANAHGEVGDGTTQMRTTPVPVGTAQRFVSLVAGEDHTCGLTGSGTAYCWGNNGQGALGDGTTTERWAPVLVSTALAFVALEADLHHTCGITPGGAAYCWGYNSRGQLGNADTTNVSTPAPVAGSLTFTALSAGDLHTCGLAGGSIYCWGDDRFGQLGDGTTAERRTIPVAVVGGIGFSAPLAVAIPGRRATR